jgi:DNA-directed RNA polymerase subunit RPC12/RpoP
MVVTCKRCWREVPSGLRELRAQLRAVECPLCSEKRRYPPSEVFLGKANHHLKRQNQSGGK